MEKNNSIPNLGQGTTSMGAMASIDPSLSIPSNLYISPLHEAIIFKPKDSSMLTTTSRNSPQIVDATQINMGNNLYNSSTSSKNLDFVDNHLGSYSSPSFTSLLLSSKSTNFHEDPILKPIESSMYTISSGEPSRIEDVINLNMGNHLYKLFCPFENLQSIDDHLRSYSSPCFTPLLLSNQPTNSHGNQFGFGVVDKYSTVNQVPISENISFPPNSSFYSMSNLHHHVGKVSVDPRIQGLPLNNILEYGNHTYKTIEPYLNPNPSHVVPQCGNNLDLSLDRFLSFLNRLEQPILAPSWVYKCNICRKEFLTPQAYGGHKSSHSKGKKARDAIEESISQLKKPKLILDNYLMPKKEKEFEMHTSMIPSTLMLSKEKGVMIEAIKEEEIEIPKKEIKHEIIDYKSDESVNSEFYTKE